MSESLQRTVTPLHREFGRGRQKGKLRLMFHAAQESANVGRELFRQVSRCGSFFQIAERGERASELAGVRERLHDAIEHARNLAGAIRHVQHLREVDGRDRAVGQHLEFRELRYCASHSLDSVHPRSFDECQPAERPARARHFDI